MPQEHRQFIRGTIRLLTFLKVLETGKVYRVLTKNLSGSGMLVAAEQALAPETKLEVEVALPDRSTPFRCQAAVVWSRPTGGSAPGRPTGADVGIKFLNLDPKDQMLLKQYAAMGVPPPQSNLK